MAKAHRNFQAVFTLFTLQYLFLGLFLAAMPLAAIRRFESLGVCLGGGPYLAIMSERGFVWRILAVGNVLTLALMSFLLQLDLKRAYPMVIPLAFMQACAAIGFFAVYLFAYPYPAFAAAFAWGWLCFFAALYFARTAYSSLSAPEDKPRGRKS